MNDTTKSQNAQAAEAIRTVFGFNETTIRVIDNPNGSGYAIYCEETGLSAIDISHAPAVFQRCPINTFLEAVNEGLLRLVRA